MEYPERRPYATTVNHSGYCAKPRPLTPQPPTDALRILNSQIGFDAPRNTRPRTTAGGGRLPALAPSEAETFDLEAQRALADTTLFPDSERRPDEALAKAKLADPFNYATNTYHTSQQGALNAELRLRVEKFLHDWTKKMNQLNELVGHYPTDGATVNYNATEALKTYFDVYRCTEDLSVSVQKLIDDAHLNTTTNELEEVEATPVLPIDNIRRSLDTLLTSKYLVAPLDQHVASLSVYDSVIRTLPVEKRTARGGDGEEVVCPSSTAVVMHEKLHHDPTEYARKELKKNEGPLLQMESHVDQAREEKEEAIDALNPVDALRSLHAQVDFSNDLLLLNKARMELVAKHGDDIRELRAAVVAVIEDAKQSAELLQERVEGIHPRLRQDIETLEEGIQSSTKSLEEFAQREVEAEKQMRQAMRERDAEEKEYWDQIQALMKKLIESAEQKEKMAQTRMSMREQRAKEILAMEELLKAQNAHHERLSHCEEMVARWEQGREVYQRYVDAFVPKLLKHVNRLEEEDEELNNREAQDYVRRYEGFAYVSEEARAKRSVQADRMRLMQRSTLLDQAAAEETLDPQGEQHQTRYDAAARELEEVTAYMQYLGDIEGDRREEIEPVLHRVMRHNVAQLNGAAAPAIEDGKAEAEAEGEAAPEEEGAEGYAVAEVPEDGAVAADGVPPPLTATMTHPHVAASHIAIAHEEAYVEKHRQLNDTELAAQEEHLGALRRSKAELAALARKYKNEDYIRELLLGAGQAAAPAEESAPEA